MYAALFLYCNLYTRLMFAVYNLHAPFGARAFVAPHEYVHNTPPRRLFSYTQQQQQQQSRRHRMWNNNLHAES